MNLQHAANNPGKFHEMRAKATKFDVKEGDYGLYALGTLMDDPDGNEEKMLFAVKKGESLVDANIAMTLCIWRVKYDANTGYFQAYFKSTVAKQLQDSSQSPQNEPESTNSHNDVVIRTRVVCAYLAGGSRPLIEDVEYWKKYCETGIDASLPGNRPMENKPEDRRASDEDIPF